MNPVRLGFIGAGGIAVRHLQALRQFEDVEIAGVFSRTPGKARAFAECCGPATRVYGSHSELLEQAGLNAVYICVPPFAHGEYELAAIHRNIPFFVEKPLAVDIATAEEIYRQANATSLVTAVGYQWRYLDTTAEARRLLAGQPARLAVGYWLDALPPPAWWSDEQLSGGQIVEQTTHIFDLARYLVGEISRVYALGRRFETAQGQLPQVDTVTTVAAEFAGGAIGQFSSTCLLNGSFDKGLQLFGAGLALELTYGQLTVDQGSGQRRVEPVKVDPFALEDRDFVDAVAGRSNRIKTDYAEALRTHRITLAAVRSAREGRPVEIELNDG